MVRGLVLWMILATWKAASTCVDLRASRRQVYATGAQAPVLPSFITECDDSVGENLPALDTGSDPDIIILPIGLGAVGYHNALQQIRDKRQDSDRTHFWVRIEVHGVHVLARVKKNDLNLVQVQKIRMDVWQQTYKFLNNGEDISFATFRRQLGLSPPEDDVNNAEWRRRTFLASMVISEAARFEWLAGIIINSLLNGQATPSVTMRNADYMSLVSKWGTCFRKEISIDRESAEKCGGRRVYRTTGTTKQQKKISLLDSFDSAGSQIVTCTCNSPGTFGSNGYTCSDASKNAYCASNELCVATTAFVYGDWTKACKVMCTCNSPGTPGSNGYTCSDASKKGYCAPNELCVATTAFVYGDWTKACKVAR